VPAAEALVAAAVDADRAGVAVAAVAVRSVPNSQRMPRRS
jgi:hypothetical protein